MRVTAFPASSLNLPKWVPSTRFSADCNRRAWVPPARKVSTFIEALAAAARSLVVSLLLLPLRATGQNPRTDLSAGQARLLHRVENAVFPINTAFSPRLASGLVALEISARRFCPIALT